MWVLYSKLVAGIINGILLIFLIIFVKNGKDIYEKLHVVDNDAVSGKFKDFGNNYQQMGDMS
jgi:hypothetical protein